MVSSKPTSHAGVYETTPNPYYPPSSFTAPGSQQPPGSINLENQAQGAQSAQPYFITSPGTSAVSQPGQGNIQMINPSVGRAVINFKEEAKVLGVIQIMVGLMHLGFGIILCLIVSPYGRVLGFASAVTSGYPFWGGLSFIISGSLSVSASKELSPCLVKGSLGMNIVSSIFAFIGVILLVVDMCIHGPYQRVYSRQGISAMLMIFSLLEVCTACVTAYFANQADTTTNMPVLVIPNMYENNPVTPASSSVPPKCNNYSN
ncbi:PREDICTED: membrane-spanning 4-domains subfamily A member 12 isoform X1 [Cercocebus atys]|uniref:membrane-spanning 4-domains subfamily A member 12 isoform X1 n=1 Tax=Cercocebus atys TaxID=9531 RepID=UPI0005F4B776|nr:PREDICTED: membrane-spanning 4-domains subfamily A member 12 isoform X1 [Cercocebus atys]XP_011887367.1 PREDICTED: membrane-spanning 4-domains subfamily A member 12 isoform X1 [Cercocebus atys]